MKKVLSSLALGAILATSLVAKGEVDMPKNVTSDWEKVFAKSEEGKGSIFGFTIPLYKEAEQNKDTDSKKKD